MLIARLILSAFLAWLAYRHASMCGRMFMNLRGLKSPIYVSPAYSSRNPLIRLLFPVVQIGLQVATWVVFPFGHWGLLAIMTSLYAYKSGMRCELLRAFVEQVLLHLEEREPLDVAWQRAARTITTVTRLRSINVERHKAHPTALVHYVARTTTSRQEASEILSRWSNWLESQSCVSGNDVGS
jgi:hypothetical protein